MSGWMEVLSVRLKTIAGLLDVEKGGEWSWEQGWSSLYSRLGGSCPSNFELYSVNLSLVLPDLVVFQVC